MAVQDDAAAARSALRALELTVATLTRHFGEAVDARRLRADVERIALDLDLLTGPGTSGATPPRLQVIEDTAYPQDFWMDAEDEGLGGSR
jgi:hypothetical protein